MAPSASFSLPKAAVTDDVPKTWADLGLDIVKDNIPMQGVVTESLNSRGRPMGKGTGHGKVMFFVLMHTRSNWQETENAPV